MGFVRNTAIFSAAVVALLGCSSAGDGGNGAATNPPADTGGVPPEDTTPPEEDVAPALTYPEGPYGFKVGNVFPNLTFSGYRDGTGDWVDDMSMIAYFDPDGTRHITGIYFVVAAQWCGPCNIEADHLGHWWTDAYKDRGAKIVSAVIQNTAGKAATQLTVDQWIAKHHVNFDMMLDGASESLPKTGSVGLPYNYLIDPRTMKVRRIIQGIDPAITTGCTSDDTCCKAGITKDSSGNDVCNQDYVCATTIKTCMTPTMAGPIAALDVLMVANGAPALDTGLKK